MAGVLGAAGFLAGNLGDMTQSFIGTPGSQGADIDAEATINLGFESAVINHAGFTLKDSLQVCSAASTDTADVAGPGWQHFVEGAIAIGLNHVLVMLYNGRGLGIRLSGS